jgi:hypothetical protein
MQRTWLIAWSVIALVSGCAQPMIAAENRASPVSAADPASIIALVSTVRQDPSQKPVLARALMTGRLFMIPDPHSKTLAVLPFYQNERSFIPVFSDQQTFDKEAYGTGFAGTAIAVDAARFASLLKGDEIVILNPGDHPAIEFRASELTAVAAQPAR